MHPLMTTLFFINGLDSRSLLKFLFTLLIQYGSDRCVSIPSTITNSIKHS